MSAPDLSVVCRNCGSEVSPYVTECPYCGTRLRKRAPKIEREGDEIKVREGRRERKLRREAGRRERATQGKARRGRIDRDELATKPVATVLILAVAAVLFVVFQAGLSTQGATAAASAELTRDIFQNAYRDDALRYLIAPFFFEDAGYLMICGLGLAIFLPPLERRLGSLAAFVLALACGSLGILAADAWSDLIGNGAHAAAGLNGAALGALAAYVAIREPERRADPDDSYDEIAVGVAAVVILAIPLFETFADVSAGVAGAILGAACGWIATRVGAGRERA